MKKSTSIIEQKTAICSKIYNDYPANVTGHSLERNITTTTTKKSTMESYKISCKIIAVLQQHQRQTEQTNRTYKVFTGLVAIARTSSLDTNKMIIQEKPCKNKYSQISLYAHISNSIIYIQALEAVSVRVPHHWYIVKSTFYCVTGNVFRLYISIFKDRTSLTFYEDYNNQ